MALLGAATIICALFVIAASRRVPPIDVNQAPALFEKFIIDYDRQYKDAADKEIHYKAFVKSLNEINRLNAIEPDNPTAAYFGITKFSDYTEEEFDQMKGIRVPEEDLM